MQISVPTDSVRTLALPPTDFDRREPLAIFEELTDQTRAYVPATRASSTLRA